MLYTSVCILLLNFVTDFFVAQRVFVTRFFMTKNSSVTKKKILTIYLA